MNKPKKLIRSKITQFLKEGEYEEVSDLDELNKLYAIKIREELIEIQQAEHKDIMEFVDLIQVATAFANQNGFTMEQLDSAMMEKNEKKGTFGRLVLNNLNPKNPSNKLYFENSIFPYPVNVLAENIKVEFIEGRYVITQNEKE